MKPGAGAGGYWFRQCRAASPTGWCSCLVPGRGARLRDHNQRRTAQSPAFQFRDRRDDHHHGATQRAGGVDLLAKADELNVQMSEFVQDLEKV